MSSNLLQLITAYNSIIIVRDLTDNPFNDTSLDPRHVAFVEVASDHTVASIKMLKHGSGHVEIVQRGAALHQSDFEKDTE
jgi:hypothetical protein